MKRFLLPLIIIVIIAGFIWYSFFRPEGSAGLFGNSTESSYAISSSSASTTETGASNASATYTLSETYTPSTSSGQANTAQHFSFKHPTGFKVSSITTEGVETILVQDAAAKVGFQIYITPIDEDIPALTVDRIKQDLPDIHIESPQDVTLGDQKIVPTEAQSGRGVAFIGDDPSFGGKSREVWFVYKKSLYQIRTYIQYDALLKSVLDTWEFE